MTHGHLGAKRKKIDKDAKCASRSTLGDAPYIIVPPYVTTIEPKRSGFKGES